MEDPSGPHQCTGGRRGDRARPGRLDAHYRVLTELSRRLARIAHSDLLPPGDRLLDYGCGSRPYETLLHSKFREYLGADLPGNPAADIPVGPGSILQLESESVDCVLSSQVLEHVEQPRAYLAEARRVLRPHGALLLSTHGVWQYHPDPADYWRWTATGLRLEIERTGFEVVLIEGILHKASTALQLWQDATSPALPRIVRWAYVWLVQTAIGGIEILQSRRPANDAAVYVVLARKIPKPI